MFASLEPPPPGSRPAVDWLVRRATAVDAVQMGQIVAEREGGEAAHHADRFARELAAIETGANTALWVGERGGEVVAFARAHLRRNRPGQPVGDLPEAWMLGGVIVAPAHRRLGIGRALVRTRLDWLATRTDTCFYCTNALNEVSQRLHEGFGFEEVKRGIVQPGMTFLGGVGVLYRCRLG